MIWSDVPVPTPHASPRALVAAAVLATGLVLGAPAAALAGSTGPSAGSTAGAGDGGGSGGSGSGSGSGTGNGRGAGDVSGPGTSTCPRTTAQQSTRGARAVFAGQVVASVRSDTADGVAGESFAQQVEVGRVYQGDLISDMVEVLSERQPQQCSLGRLQVGTTYVFFVQGAGSPEDPWVAQGAGGTAPETTRLVSQVERLLGPGREPVAPSRETAEFTPVEFAEPVPLTRMAAPGAALMLIGLLGLLVVGRLGRRS